MRPHSGYKNVTMVVTLISFVKATIFCVYIKRQHKLKGKNWLFIGEKIYLCTTSKQLSVPVYLLISTEKIFKLINYIPRFFLQCGRNISFCKLFKDNIEI